MATQFTEGFDKYGPGLGSGTNNAPTGGGNQWGLTTMLTQGEWTTTGGAPTNGTLAIVPPLSATGYALFMQGGNNSTVTVTRTLASSLSTVIAGLRFNATVAQNDPGIGFLGSNTTAFFVRIQNGTGLIYIQNGAGTTLATSSVSVTANTTHYLELDVTIGSNAAFNVYLDGQQIISGTGNTGNGLTSVNQLQLSAPGGIGASQATWTVDDLYVFDTTTSFNNAPLLSNPRIETDWPISDSQTQWTNVSNILGSNYSATNAYSGFNANVLLLRPFIAQVNCSLQSVHCVPGTTASAANFKAVLYADSSGSPGSLVATGTQVTGSTDGVELHSNFSSGQSLTAGTQYWIGFITDTANNFLTTDTTTQGQQASNTYTNGAPATAPSMTVNQASWSIWGVCTGAATNWESEAQISPPGDESSITSQTVGNEDLYNFPALTHSPANVYTVGVKCLTRITLTGTRLITCQTKSGTTDSPGSNSSGSQPALSYAWIDSYFDTDPNTGAAWAVAAVNAALSGPKVVA